MQTLGKSTCVRPRVFDYQPFPTEAPLADLMNLSLPALRARVGEERGLALSYVLSTCEVQHGPQPQLRHTGCGPNFQGGSLTLCTCKHRMRRGNGHDLATADQWRGVWIAGWSSIDDRTGDHVLFYLAKVQSAFESAAAIWLALSPASRQAKSATTSVFGDCYEPRPGEQADWDPADYVPPRADHRHAPNGGWRQDVTRQPGERPSWMMLCDPQRTFLWSRPLIRFAGSPAPTQGHKKWPSVRTFVDCLGEVGMWM